MKGDDIVNRLLDQAMTCLNLASRLESSPAGRHIARQLIRCATSTGANYEEGRSAESPADFIHKIGIAAKEQRETLWWLRVIERGKVASCQDLDRSIDEANELVAILVASARTARQRANRPRRLDGSDRQ